MINTIDREETLADREPPAPAPSGASGGAEGRPAGRPAFHKRSDVIADEIKRWIVAEGLVPGDRLPQERALSERFGVSKGTMREALKALEVQGLVRFSTGPQGGGRVAKVPLETAAALLGNYFHFEEISVDHLYQLRLLLEPELAAQVTPQLTEDDLATLERLVTLSDCVPADRSMERGQRLAELDFHDVLAERCDNALLRFTCRFINALIKNGVVYQVLMDGDDAARGRIDNVEPMVHDGVVAHRELIDAFRARDAEKARALMRHHMDRAYAHLRHMEARLAGGFLGR